MKMAVYAAALRRECAPSAHFLHRGHIFRSRETLLYRYLDVLILGGETGENPLVNHAVLIIPAGGDLDVLGIHHKVVGGI